MSWKTIFKIEDYVREKLDEYKRKLKTETDPEKKQWLEDRIKYYEQLED